MPSQEGKSSEVGQELGQQPQRLNVQIPKIGLKGQLEEDKTIGKVFTRRGREVVQPLSR